MILNLLNQMAERLILLATDLLAIVLAVFFGMYCALKIFF